jgi:RNA-directed DNA polymerase
MREPHIEGIANHGGPESGVAAREGGGEARTGVRAGRVFSREIMNVRGADAVVGSGRQHPSARYRERRRGPARSETPRMHGISRRENREISRSLAAVARRDVSGRRMP